MVVVDQQNSNIVTGPVYGRAARDYLRAGFSCPLPVGHGPAEKDGVPAGYTGGPGYLPDGRPRLVGLKDLERWSRTHADRNIGLRLIGGLAGIDVDAHSGKDGAATFAAMQAELGPLPPTCTCTARDDGVSGIRLLRLPAGTRVSGDVEARIAARFGHGVDVIREDYRYMVVWPSVHPDLGGAIYRWRDGDAAGPVLDGVPERDRVADFPPGWVAFLTDTGTGPAEDRAERNGHRTVAVRDEFDLPGEGERAYDRTTAEGIIRRQLAEVEKAGKGEINSRLNNAALYLFHFAPAFVDDRELAGRLVRAQEKAWLAAGGRDDKDYRAARATIRSARAKARSEWTAVLADEDDESPDPLEAIAEEADGDGESEAASDEKGSTKRAGIFFTDARFSELVADLFRRSGLGYCPELGWTAWNGVIWERLGKDDGDDHAIEINRKWCLKRWRIAKETLDRAENDETGSTPATEVARLAELADAWRTMCSRSKLTATVALARPQVKIRFESFDAWPDLINSASGIVDLRTGELGDHDRDKLLTRVTRAPYRGAGYTHETWDKAVEAIPEDCRDWIQMFMGQGITGRLNTEGRLLLLDGDGSNGKGVLTNEGAVWALGDYAVVLSESLLMDSGGQHPTEKMALRGARLTLIDETPEARRLDTQRLKKLLDQPVLTGARHLYREGKPFELTHTMIVMTNYVPAVTEFDRGTWRRLVRLKMPFTYKGRSEPRTAPGDRMGDPDLKTALREDGDVQAACLAWLVRGAMKWYASGRCQPLGDEPARITADTTAWRAGGDLIMNYAGEFLQFDRGCHVPASEMHAHFSAWCETNGNRPWSLKTFLDRLHGHEVVKDKGAEIVKAVVRKDGDRVSRPPEARGGLPQRYTRVCGVAYGNPEEDPCEGEDFEGLDA